MKIETGYLYHIKDDFFEKINDKNLMINHDKGHSRPSYLAIKDNDVLWFVPLSTKIDKYQREIDKKIKKYGKCKTILIKEIAGVKEAILLQNTFPTTKEYINNIHTIEGHRIRISTSVEREIIYCLNYMFIMKEKGINLFFTNIDYIQRIIKETNK